MNYEDKPAGLLVFSLGKAINGIISSLRLRVLDPWLVRSRTIAGSRGGLSSKIGPYWS